MLYFRGSGGNLWKLEPGQSLSAVTFAVTRWIRTDYLPVGRPRQPPVSRDHRKWSYRDLFVAFRFSILNQTSSDFLI